MPARRASSLSAAGPTATRPCSTAAPARRPSCPARRRTDGRPVPAEQDLLRDPDRHPGPLVQRRRLAVLPGHARVLRRDRRTVHPGRPTLADLEPRVLRQHDHGQRQHVAVPDGRAAPLPLPLPQRLPVALPDPRLRRSIPGVEVWQIGNEGGFLAAPVNLTATTATGSCMGPAERADLIVDFTNVPVGQLRAAATSVPTSPSAAVSRASTSRSPTRPPPARSCSSASCRRWPPTRRRRRSSSRCPPSRRSRPRP